MAAQMTSQAHGWYSAVRAFLLNSIGIFLPAFMEGSAVAMNREGGAPASSFACQHLPSQTI